MTININTFIAQYDFINTMILSSAYNMCARIKLIWQMVCKDRSSVVDQRWNILQEKPEFAKWECFGFQPDDNETHA